MFETSDNSHETSPSPRKNHRRWFQYRLRTLFLITTALGAWLGWESHVVRERRAALEQIDSAGGSCLTVSGMRELWPAAAPLPEFPSMPRVREWFGDEAIASITISTKTTADEERRIVKLFPEAHVGKPSYSQPFDVPQLR